MTGGNGMLNFELLRFAQKVLDEIRAIRESTDEVNKDNIREIIY